MNDWIDIEGDDAHVARERTKARELRTSAWWQQKLAAGKCHYCGQSFSPEELTMDHVIPVVRGGKSTRGNVVPACAACNATKKYMTPAEMILKSLEGGKG